MIRRYRSLDGLSQLHHTDRLSSPVCSVAHRVECVQDDAADYHYFADPDLPPSRLDPLWLDAQCPPVRDAITLRTIRFGGNVRPASFNTVSPQTTVPKRGCRSGRRSLTRGRRGSGSAPWPPIGDVLATVGIRLLFAKVAAGTAGSGRHIGRQDVFVDSQLLSRQPRQQHLEQEPWSSLRAVLTMGRQSDPHAAGDKSRSRHSGQLSASALLPSRDHCKPSI